MKTTNNVTQKNSNVRNTILVREYFYISIIIISCNDPSDNQYLCLQCY